MQRVAQVLPQADRSLGTEFRKEFERDFNIIALLHGNVLELELEADTSRIGRVQVGTLSGGRFGVRAAIFVLATGGIENARLLLASSRERPAGRGNENDLVGRYFGEHPRFVGGLIRPADPLIPLTFYGTHQAGPGDIEGYLALDPATRREEGLVDVQLDVRPIFDGPSERAINSEDAESLRALLHILRRGGREAGELGEHLAHVVADLFTFQRYAVPGAPIPVPYPEIVGELMRRSPVESQALIPELLGDIATVAYRELAGTLPLQTIVLSCRVDPVPDPASRISLGTERDALGMPRVQIDWRLGALDRHSVYRTLEIVAAEIGRSGLGRLQILLEPDRADWPADLAGGAHHTGTTRMSDDPRRGVVDRDCRVHGLANLFVAGSSVFPGPGSGTPTLTLVALELRLADHLRGLLG